MPVRQKRGGENRGGVLTYCAVVVLAVLYFLHRSHAELSGLPLFWDAHVYARALRDWRQGLNPYAQAAPGQATAVLPFVSPPVFLYLARFLGLIFPGRIGFSLYCLLASLCSLAVPTLLAVFYLRSRWMVASLAVFLSWFLPGGYGSQAVLTGNLSNVLYAALLAAGVPGLRRNRWAPFYAVLVVAGLMKPPFLAFLLLPLLQGERQWRPSVGAVLAVLAGDLAQKVGMPVFWDEFQRGVVQRVFVRGDAGFGLLGQFAALGGHVPALQRLPAPVASLLAILFLLASVFALRKRRFGGPGEKVWLPCLVVLAVLSNPRVLDYDANLAVVPAVFVAVEFFRSLPLGRSRGLQVGVPVTLFLGLEARDADVALCVLMVASVLMVLGQLLWPRYFRGCGGEFEGSQGVGSSAPAGRADAGRLLRSVSAEPGCGTKKWSHIRPYGFDEHPETRFGAGLTRAVTRRSRYETTSRVR